MTPLLVEVIFKEARGRYYTNPQQLALLPHELVVVGTETGHEVGAVGKASNALSEKKTPAGEILRRAGDEDVARLQANRRREGEAHAACLALIAKHDLQMKLVDVESRFDGSKLTFFFTAEKRVDFRGLVRDLAAMFKGRIEMHQIGVRDEARRVGGFGLCGRELCCVKWLQGFEPVTLKMAKEQNLSMTSNKMLGLCGRLMCCLTYEDGYYEEIYQSMPKVGSVVLTRQGEGTVFKVDIFKQKLHVRFDEGHGEFDVSEITEVKKKKA
jgi:cell fate regulator YaaT (PSP1 superfamily)